MRACIAAGFVADRDLRGRHMGATMVEVLVAMLIVSLGMLGIAGLSAATYGYNKVAQLRLTGLTLVNGYADRARLNTYGYDLGAYAIALSASTPTVNDVRTAKEALRASETDPLTAARNVADFDRQLFLRTVANRLPQGRAVVITNPTAAARNVDVWLLWQEPTTASKDGLFQAGQANCPSDLSDAHKALYSCMYFTVGL